jgi:hypothetical protein
MHKSTDVSTSVSTPTDLQTEEVQARIDTHRFRRHRCTIANHWKSVNLLCVWPGGSRCERSHRCGDPLHLLLSKRTRTTTNRSVRGGQHMQGTADHHRFLVRTVGHFKACSTYPTQCWNRILPSVFFNQFCLNRGRWCQQAHCRGAWRVR